MATKSDNDRLLEEFAHVLPNPADALTNPVRYWTDVWAFQMKMGQSMYEAAASVNPFLPQMSFEAGAAVAPRNSAPARKPASDRATATVEHLPTPAKPAPARKPRAKAATAAPAAAKAKSVHTTTVETKPAPQPRSKPPAKAAAKPARKTAAKTTKTTAPKATTKPATTRRRTPPAKSEG